VKVQLDHVGIAVQSLEAALAFYRDALGLQVEVSEEVTSQRVRAHFISVGTSTLELLEATANDSAIAKYIARRGPGLHHLTLRVDDLDLALETLKSKGVRMIDMAPRPGAEAARVAFIHPAAAHGVLVELKEDAEGAAKTGWSGQERSARIGIIGGSGLYDMAELSDREERTLTTPFGEPSGPYTLATLRGQRVAFLARHGRGHRLLPSDLNFRANIFGFKLLGVEAIISASAVGSLREEVKPLDLMFPDQFIDRTYARRGTFFGDGLVAHVGFAQPLCGSLRQAASQTADRLGVRAHPAGTYVCMEGPQFSTLAESHLYRSWGADIIGMTNLQEAKLAREAEICYATLALVTDYDCWHPDHDSVSVEMIIRNLTQNAATAQQVIAAIVEGYAQRAECHCGSALANAILTQPDAIPDAVRRRLAPLIEKYIS